MTCPGLLYEPGFLTANERAELVACLGGFRPLWEDRHPPGRRLRSGQTDRRLLRPVYWLGGWQFACHNYYQGTADRVVEAEPFPPVLARVVERIEARAHALFGPSDVPAGWRLNTCLINFYGHALRNARWVDTARVGAHRDNEPGPIASLSLGAPARFQFTETRRAADQEAVYSGWLEDASLLLFGTRLWKRDRYHKVTRVRDGALFEIPLEGFRVRRVNFTLRHVPEHHIRPYAALAAEERGDIAAYIATLARHSPFFANVLRGTPPP